MSFSTKKDQSGLTSKLVARYDWIRSPSSVWVGTIESVLWNWKIATCHHLIGVCQLALTRAGLASFFQWIAPIHLWLIKVEYISQPPPCTITFHSLLADKLQCLTWLALIFTRSTSAIHTFASLPRNINQITVPDFCESFDDNFVVTSRVEFEEAAQQLLEFVLCVYLFLHDHLKHGLPEVLIRVVGVFHHGNAVVDFVQRWDRRLWWLF